MKIKVHYFSILFLLTSLQALACATKVDPKKVVLFVDTNQGEPEMVAAKRAAFKNCQTFYSFPSARANIPAQLDKVLADFNTKGIKVKSVIVSGHDGGGSFGGSKGSINKQAIASSFQKYPAVNEINTAVLLGCYTGVNQEMIYWKGNFPKLGVIAGFDGSAPLSTRPYGHQFLEDVLAYGKKIKSNTSETQVDATTKKLLKTINDVYAAVYVDISCLDPAAAGDDDQQYLYSSLRGRKFVYANLSDCEGASEAIYGIKEAFNNFMSGEKEPPLNSTSGELRKIYNTVKKYEHCLNGSGGINSNNVFNLLFWNGVKKNFAKFYEADLLKAQQILGNLSPAARIAGHQKIINQNAAEIKKYQAQLLALKNTPALFKKNKTAEYTAVIKSHEAYLARPTYKTALAKYNNGERLSPAEEQLVSDERLVKAKSLTASKELEYLNTGYFESVTNDKIDRHKYIIDQEKSTIEDIKTYAQETPKFFMPTMANIVNKTRKQILQNIHTMDGLRSLPGMTEDQQNALQWAIGASNEHLSYFDNPFEWHEYTGKSHTPPNPIRLKDFLLK